ncbi:hypothetical protein LOTGIDRAFT_239176 [Lottia gigantea]|uniref:Ig-like domain-containing protein n=1 Tax=Lottia gigantea TaxID=225164 RepID=V4AQS9_LOTGI|nr:hypothetical protein LOTGIDRAFT_239176 [Lottia gigantea]ESO97185.1 hypothetical protein LOTGIDRAFT_239176 [Lottia gigantea]
MEYKYILILIVVVYLPVLITGQYTIRGVPESYAVLGENYRLQCNVTDSPSLVRFYRNNVIVCSSLSSTCESQPTDNRYKCGCINDNNTQLYLNISNINKQDDTTWSCRDGPENIIFNPTSDNIDVIEGKSQNVNCLADCKPDCNITWSKDGSTTILNNPLSLSTRDQTGSYNCTVRHTVLNKQLTKQLNVQIYYGPDELTFSSDVTSINIIEGRDQTITCLTDCFKCIYKWTGPVASSTKDLVLTQIKSNQEGNYRCEATNIKNTIPKTRSKSIQVNVHYPPYITSITSNAVNNETDEGSDITLNCNVDSKPVSTITWSSSTSTNTYIGQQWALTQAKCQDTGIYTCTANNGIGQSTTKSLPLNIRCKFILSPYTIIYTSSANNGIGQSPTKALLLNLYH